MNFLNRNFRTKTQKIHTKEYTKLKILNAYVIPLAGVKRTILYFLATSILQLWGGNCSSRYWPNKYNLFYKLAHQIYKIEAIKV